MVHVDCTMIPVDSTLTLCFPYKSSYKALYKAQYKAQYRAM